MPIALLFIALAIYYSFFLVENQKNKTEEFPKDNQNNIVRIWPTNFSWWKELEAEQQTWFVEKGWIVFTWLTAHDIFVDIESNPETDLEFYSSYVQKWNYASFVPADQKKMNWWYASKTQMMNTYLADNTFNFNIPNNIKKWYLYIKLRKPNNDWIFLFWYGSDNNWYKVSWDLILSKNLIKDNSEEYLFNLSDIPYIKYHDKSEDTYNWLSELQKWNSKFIAWFLRVYDWTNKIDQISIAWE